MKIVHVAPFYVPVIGGVEEVVKRVAEHMVKRGYDVYVVTYNRLRQGGVGSLPRYEVINGVHVIRLRPDFIWSHGSYSSELPVVIRELKPDIVHVHVWRHPHIFQIARLKNSLKFKAFLHGHAPFHRFSQLDVISWFYHHLVDLSGVKFLNLYDIYIALTPYEAEKISYLGFDKDRVVVIPNGVEEDKCNINNAVRNEYQILYLGRISRSKNLKLLIKSMEYINKEVKDSELILAGPDEGLIKDLIVYAKKKNLKIRYLGVVSEDEKHKLYLQSYIYVLPSLYEPFGITLLEAAQHGLPSIITGFGGQQYVALPNITSLWAKSTPKEYAETVITLLTNKDMWKKLSQNSIKYVRNFLWNIILLKYEKLYNKFVM
jgi:glycosyltransferase involved in cell wall biosynthesis